MNWRSVLKACAWLVLPLITIAVTIYFVFIYLETASNVAHLLAPLVILTCLYAITLTVAIQRLMARISSLLGEKKSNRRVEKDLVTRYEDLQNQIELLSAMRNVSHVVNDAVEFRTILEEVTRIVTDLTGASEITVFLVTERSLKLQPAVHRQGEVVVFDEDIKRLRIDRRHVYQALQHRTVLRNKGDNHVNFVVPLIADQEALGVIQAVIPISGEVDEVAGGIERSEATLVALAKHISLAIKTPILYNRAVIDGLTGLYTKRHFQHQLATNFNASKRLDKPLALIMLDIDHFKKINDKHGHLTGDRVLTSIALTISKTIRQYDSAYRYGGEELAIILPESGMDDALLVAERIRRKISEEEFHAEDGKKLSVTVSLGVSAFRPEFTDMKELIAEADASLYFAKQNGRNQVAVCRDGEYASLEHSDAESDNAPAKNDPSSSPRRLRRKSAPPAT